MQINQLETIYIAQNPSPSAIFKQEQAPINLLSPGWVPFWQTIAWLIFWIFTIRYINKYFRPQISQLLNVLILRVQEGSSLTIPNILELGAPPAIKNQQVRMATAEGITGKEVSEEINQTVLHYHQHHTDVVDNIYLLHKSEEILPKTAEKRGSYRVRVWLEAESTEDFYDCFRVTYRLHKSFKHQIIATESHKNQFELWLNLWGEFTIIAYVERKNNKEPLWLTRYLDLPGRPVD